MDSAERLNLDPKSSVDEKFIQDYIENNSIIDQLDQSQLWRQIVMGKLPPALNGLDEVSETKTLILEQFGFLSPSEKLEWYEQEGTYYEQTER